jgi:hypothetical protein
MNRFQPSTPHAVLGFAALAMACLTIGAMVIVPAQLDAATVAGVGVASALVCNPTREKS